MTHREWGCDSPGMHTFTDNGDVDHGECIPLPGMGVCLIGNAYPHREWGCASSGMHIFTGNAHSLYRVVLCSTYTNSVIFFFDLSVGDCSHVSENHCFTIFLVTAIKDVRS